MKIENDIRKIKLLAKERDDKNWRFRTFLKGADYSVEKLDAIVHRHYQTVAAQIDCRACANCCREAVPNLSRSDIARLASALKTTETNVIEKYLEPRKEADTFSFRKTPCPFLSDSACTVYDARPLNCRSFPHLHKDEFVFRLMQVVQNCSVCPIVFNVYERLKDELWHKPTGLWMDEDFEERAGTLDKD